MSQTSYVSVLEAPEQTGPTWLRDIRRAAMQSFSDLGFPTTRDEEWRFTNIAPLTRMFPWDKPMACPEIAGHRPARPPGVIVTTFQDAFDNSEIERHLARHADYKRHAFVALNTAFIEDGQFVYVPAGLIINDPIHLTHISAPDSQVSHPRKLIVLGARSQVSIIESYIGEGQYFTNAVTEIVAGEEAIVDHYKLQQESDSAFHIATIQVQQDRQSIFRSHSISLGGALTRNDVNCVLAEGSECTLNGLYMVAGQQHVDTHTSIDHAQPHATSHELYKGILNGHSSAVFNGKIIVRKDAQKTDAKQTNKNLVLSEDSTINTKPELQIYADDVRCTHGATVGQLDDEAIFYLRSRGVGLEAARRMLTHAFAREIIDGIRWEAFRNQTEALLR